MSEDMVDFFISYNSHDTDWAVWVAAQLEDEGYTTIVQEWDFVAGSNFVLEMHTASVRSRRTIMVLSQHYLDALFTQPEWASTFGQDPTGRNRTLVPIRVADCTATGLLRAIRYIDLVGLDEPTAKGVLLAEIKMGRLKPLTPPAFPGPSSNQFSTSFEVATHMVDCWCKDRVKAISEHQFLMSLTMGPTLVLHLVPLVQCDPELGNSVLEGHGRELKPLYSNGWGWQFGEHGFMTYSKFSRSERPHSYTHLFRTGEVEAVDTALMSGERVIPSMPLEREVMTAVRLYLPSMKYAGIQLPIAVFVSLVHVRGYALGFGSSGAFSPLESNIVSLPMTVIHDWNDDVPERFRPMFDRLWHIFGQRGSPSYETGVWKPIAY